jgi:hypothetical protein
LNGVNMRKFARALEAADEQERYNQLTAFGSPSVALDPGPADPTDVPPLPDAVGRLIYRDMSSYLTGDILVKLDRATMAESLEARCPFLDDRIVEFAWRLPTSVKIRDGQGKKPLRRVLRRYLPESLFERPKQGFNVPIGEWLTGPLRGWAEELLDEASIRREGLLDSGRIQACWQQHLSHFDGSGLAQLCSQFEISAVFFRRRQNGDVLGASNKEIDSLWLDHSTPCSSPGPVDLRSGPAIGSLLHDLARAAPGPNPFDRNPRATARK